MTAGECIKDWLGLDKTKSLADWLGLNEESKMNLKMNRRTPL